VRFEKLNQSELACINACPSELCGMIRGMKITLDYVVNLAKSTATLNSLNYAQLVSFILCKSHNAGSNVIYLLIQKSNYFSQ
jgi:hypothetical protein